MEVEAAGVGEGKEPINIVMQRKPNRHVVNRKMTRQEFHEKQRERDNARLAEEQQQRNARLAVAQHEACIILDNAYYLALERYKRRAIQCQQFRNT